MSSFYSTSTSARDKRRAQRLHAAEAEVARSSKNQVQRQLLSYDYCNETLNFSRYQEYQVLCSAHPWRGNISASKMMRSSFPSLTLTCPCSLKKCPVKESGGSWSAPRRLSGSSIKARKQSISMRLFPETRRVNFTLIWNS